MKRTASIGSRVPPAVTSTRRPVEVAARRRRPPRPRRAAPVARAAARAALPERAERADAGLEHGRRRARAACDVVLGRRVLPHRVVHRGATTSGRRQASAAVVSRLSASPAASLAIVFARSRAQSGRRRRARRARGATSGSCSGCGSPGKAPRVGSRSHSLRQHRRPGDAGEGGRADEARRGLGLDHRTACPAFIARRVNSSAL